MLTGFNKNLLRIAAQYTIHSAIFATWDKILHSAVLIFLPISSCQYRFCERTVSKLSGATLHPKVVVTGVGNIWRVHGARAYNGCLGASLEQ